VRLARLIMDTLFCDSLSESDFLYNPGGGTPQCHSATIVETAGGDLLTVWYAYPEKENVGAILVSARRAKGAGSWSPTQVVLASAANSLGNPVLSRTPNGPLLLFYVALRGNWWNSAALHLLTSTDHGHTWSSPTFLGAPAGLMVRHPPVCLPNADLLLPAYDESSNRTILLKAAPPYTDWDECYRFAPPDLIQPVILADPRGNLDIYFRAARAPGRVWRSMSKDRGETWEPPQQTALINPLSGIAAVRSDGILALIHNPIEYQRSPLAISLSPNSGHHWSGTYVLDSAPFEVSYPSFILGGDGMVRGVYTFNRRMIKYVAFPSHLFGHGAK
jgi:predicted neuraminidase